MGRNARIGAIANIVVGIIGAFIGGWVMSLFGVQGVTGFNLPSLLVAIAGAVSLLFVVGLLRHKNTKSPMKEAQEIQSPSVSPKIQQKIETQNLPAVSARKIVPGIVFISYRRTDSADVAGRIYDRLLGGFSKSTVFKDVDSIPLGFDFKEYLEEKVSECSVLLAIIGDRWLGASDSVGRRRLDDPNDFVRIEIESALAREIPVIPLLVRGALMPSEEELPASLKKLVYRNGIQIRPDPDFHRDMDRLISTLKRYVQPKD
jgi:uncharacterized membrane protein YeaQ/YmgE (transglycosylase-associated protein family)